MKKRIFTTFIVALMLCACANENKTLADDLSVEEGSTANVEDAASEESSETANVSENHMVDYNSYDELIEDIKRVLNEWETSDNDSLWDEVEHFYWFSHRVSLSFAQIPERFGYLIEDIDGDGVDEFLLGDNGVEENLYGIYSMFTIRDGKVAPVFESGLRDGYILYKDGVIEREFSFANSSGGVEYYNYTAGNLELIESAYYVYELSGAEWREVYYYSDSESQKRELTEKEYNEKCDELDHKYNKQEMPLHLNVFMDEM